MQEQIGAKFSIKQWEEKPYLELEDGVKMAQAHVVTSYQGDLVGEGKLEYLMYYTAGGSYHFVGLEHFSGQVGGRSGSFVLQHHGKDENGAVRGHYSVVPGSGTGELANLRGQGTYLLAGHADQYDFPFEYSLD